VYNGTEPYDCSIDSYGDLYISDIGKNSIYIIYSNDLYYNTPSSYIAYTSEYLDSVSSPIGLDIHDHYIYWVNNEDGKNSGTIV